jgi:hypothetical protein
VPKASLKALKHTRCLHAFHAGVGCTSRVHTPFLVCTFLVSMRYVHRVPGHPAHDIKDLHMLKSAQVIDTQVTSSD